MFFATGPGIRLAWPGMTRLGSGVSPVGSSHRRQSSAAKTAPAKNPAPCRLVRQERKFSGEPFDDDDEDEDDSDAMVASHPKHIQG